MIENYLAPQVPCPTRLFMTQYLNIIWETDVYFGSTHCCPSWVCEFQLPVSSLIDPHLAIYVFSVSSVIVDTPFTHLRTIRCQQGLTAVGDSRELNTFSQHIQRQPYFGLSSSFFKAILAYPAYGNRILVQ